MMRRAVIDVGTNSVKLLVADVSGREVEPVCEESTQTRLGQGFYDSHVLQAGRITATASAVAGYVTRARGLGATVVRVIATSAARDAHNRAELLDAIHSRAGVMPVVISGEREAELAFAGVASNSLLANVPLLLLDVGGGSTEFIVGEGVQRHFRGSFPIGTVRLLEKMRPDDPPSERQHQHCEAHLREYVKGEILPLLKSVIGSFPGGKVRLVGTGGTTTILARLKLKTDSFDRALIERVRLTDREVEKMGNLLWSLPLEERRRLPGLPGDRADVILAGVSIYNVVLREFSITELSVSTRGLRFAAVVDGALDEQAE